MDPIRDPEENEVTYLYELGRLENARVLEIGCGSGRMTWRYAFRPRSIAGLDPDPERLAKAVADRPPALANKVSFLAGNAETLPLRDESFDTVILSWSL
jgi:ubiquinone/menaquinone biosynthesis C-methylase UbiE